MHISNFQTIRRSRGIAAFQWLRAVIVLTLAATGAFAVSLTAEDVGAPEATVSAGTQDATSTVQVVDQQAQSPSTSSAPATQVASADSNVADLSVDHAMDMGSSAAPVPQAAPAGMPDSTPRADAPAIMPAGPNTDSSLHEAKQASVTPPPAAPEMTGAVTVASIAGNTPPASDLVDLNTASFEQLNKLRNAGPLGRAIVKGRPYASVEDLVKRKVMRRSTYEKIKDQVTVR